MEDMADFIPEQSQEPPRMTKPTAVWVFGVLNIVFGCYFMARIVLSWSITIAEIFKNPEKTTWSGGILTMLFFIIGVGLGLWLIMLGVGLLTMKRWARRGSVLYGWIQVILIALTIGAIVISSITDLENAPRILRASITLDNGLAMIHWAYMVLLLIFMRSAKVKEAFKAIGG